MAEQTEKKRSVFDEMVTGLQAGIEWARGERALRTTVVDPETGEVLSYDVESGPSIVRGADRETAPECTSDRRMPYVEIAGRGEIEPEDVARVAGEAESETARAGGKQAARKR